MKLNLIVGRRRSASAAVERPWPDPDTLSSTASKVGVMRVWTDPLKQRVRDEMPTHLQLIIGTN